MQGFYNLSNKIRETLQLDAFVNTVTYGDIFDVDSVSYTHLRAHET